jgi:hypothetical protein
VPVTVNKRGPPSGPRAYRSRDSRVLSRCGNMQSSTQTEQHRDLFGRVSVCLSMSTRTVSKFKVKLFFQSSNTKVKLLQCRQTIDGVLDSNNNRKK